MYRGRPRKGESEGHGLIVPHILTGPALLAVRPWGGEEGGGVAINKPGERGSGGTFRLTS